MRKIKENLDKKNKNNLIRLIIIRIYKEKIYLLNKIRMTAIWKHKMVLKKKVKI